MLAMADRKGRIWGSVPGLANRARVSVEACRIALNTFLSPDPDSRTKTAEGRRIEEIDGGWRLINHEKYRDIRDSETIKEQTAERVRAYRKKRNVTPVTHGNANAEADTEADSGIKSKSVSANRGTRLPQGWLPTGEGTLSQLAALELDKFRDYWIAQPGQKGVKTDWDATWRNWLRKAKDYEQRPAKLSAVERVHAAADKRAAERGRILETNGVDVRPQMDDGIRRLAGQAMDSSDSDVGF